MKQNETDELSLKETEAQVLAEGREWMRQRLEQRLQAQARAASAVFPPTPTTDAAADPAHGDRRREAGGGLWARSANGSVGVSGTGEVGFGAAPEDDAGVGGSGVPNGDAG